MKKYLLICTLICLAILGAACVAPPPQPAVEEESIEPLNDFPVKDGHYIFEEEKLGLSFGIPVGCYDDHTIDYWPLSLQDSPPDTQPLDGIQVLFFPPGLLEEIATLMISNDSAETLLEVEDMLNTRSRQLYSIQFYSAGLWDSWISSGKTFADITGNKENIELGRQNGRVYVYTEPTTSGQGFSEEELPSYRLAVAAIPAMRDHAAMLEKAPAKAKNAFQSFSTVDIYDKAVDYSIFADYDLTMLNIWGTFCGPCIMEMPYLGEMAADMPAGTQLIGLVGDALEAKGNIELAQDIAERTGANYIHLVPDKALYDYLSKNIVGYPTTIFIDKEGNLVGQPIVGAVSREQYENELSKRLEKINEQ
jgi:thiol-disulfide isomerase/thioredoxin